MAIRVQVILRRADTLKRPVIFFSPPIGAHYEYCDRLFAYELRPRSFQEVVIPLQDQVVIPTPSRQIAIVKPCRFGAKIDIPDFLPRAGVTANDDDESLILARDFSSGVLLRADIVA